MGASPQSVNHKGEALTDGMKGESQSEKKRSEISYPYYSLKQSIEFTEAVRRAGGGEASDADVMRELGISEKTSRRWGYGIPAAAQFGLITRVGRGDDARIKVTDLAKRILLPANEVEGRAATMEALRQPKLYSDLLDRYGGHPLPTKDGLKNVLERDFKILPSMTPFAADAFIESVKFAGVVTVTGIIAVDNVPSAEKPLVPPGGGVSGDKPMQTVSVPASFIPHHFQLRKDLRVTIPLPHDVTSREVARLSKWMSTLPLEEDDEEPTVPSG